MLELNRWRWLGVEFTVIVLGVLSAMFVDTWLQDRQDAERAAVYQQRLSDDLERDLVNLDAVTDYYADIRAHGLAVLADLEGRQALDDFQLLFSAFNAAEEWGFLLEDATYGDLQSTGGLALLDDVEFRLDLADYHRAGENKSAVWNLPRDYRELARGIIPDDLQSDIHQGCTASAQEVHVSARSRAPGVSVFPGESRAEPLTASASSADFCGLDPSDYEIADIATEFRADPALPRLLRYRVSQIRVAIALFANQREMAENLLQSLGEHH